MKDKFQRFKVKREKKVIRNAPTSKKIEMQA